jgi:type I restriction enzyme S subunit
MIVSKSVPIGSLALDENGAFKIGPFGSSLKKSELVPQGIPVVGIENVLPNDFSKGFRRFISPKKFKELSDYAILPGDVLVTTMGTIGRAAVAPASLGTTIFDSHIFRMRVDRSRVEPDYLAYALNSDLVVSQLSRDARGAIMEGLNTTILRECEIPVPPLSEQRRIVDLLEKADRLRRTRRYALELSRTFLSAVFLDLFGARFSEGPISRLGELVSITGGGTPSRDRPDFYRGRIPWLTSKDMRGDYIRDTEEHVTEDAIKHSATKLVPKGSILVVVKSKVLMHRLPVAIASVALCHGQDIKSIQCSKRLHPEFARFALKYHESRLLNIARGANTEGLTLPMLEELPIPHVDFKEQNRFAVVVSRHERLRSAERETLRQADHLFLALLHRTFAH